MASRLDRILSGVREDLERRKSAVPFSRVEEKARRNARGRPFPPPGAAPPWIIAEIKRASPSKGWIRRDLDAAVAARTYAGAGACAVSVLTESRLFGGSLSDLATASAVSGSVPVLRKDFLLDAYMLAESRAFGADLALLIVAVLGEETEGMVRKAAAFGMEALVEVHDEEEMEVARRTGARLIGINNRDLSTLRVDLSTSRRLLPLAPKGCVRIVESGIASPEEIRELRALGAEAFLIGEALVRSDDPAAEISRFRGTASATKV
jgi:indole-3-glycerol phosphate synthase